MPQPPQVQLASLPVKIHVAELDEADMRLWHRGVEREPASGEIATANDAQPQARTGADKSVKLHIATMKKSSARLFMR